MRKAHCSRLYRTYASAQRELRTQTVPTVGSMRWGDGRDRMSDVPRSAIDRRTPVEELPEFLSPEEFRAYVGISRSTVYELLRKAEIPHVKFGRCIRIPKAALHMSSAGEVK